MQPFYGHNFKNRPFCFVLWPQFREGTIGFGQKVDQVVFALARLTSKYRLNWRLSVNTQCILNSLNNIDIVLFAKQQ